MNLQFETITLEKQGDYLERLAKCPQVASDYSFINLWAWCEEYGLRWAWDDELVWIKQTYPEVFLWAPVGPWQDVDWKGTIDINATGRLAFIRVPEKLTDLWRENFGESATMEEERGHWDYVYGVEDLVKLAGNRYHKKKNLLNQFNKKYEYKYAPLGPELVEHAMGMQTDWCTWRDCESSDVLSAENRAVFRTLRDWDLLDRKLGGAIMVNDEMVAYTVAEAITDDTVVVHFEKGDTEYKGVYQAVNQIFLAHSAQAFSFVNREQDLNDEGLRKAKLSYHPIDFLRKYGIVLSGTFRV
jgi:hypothetical protein